MSRHVQALHLLNELRRAFADTKPDMGEIAFPSPTGGHSQLRHAALEGIPAYSVLVRADWVSGQMGPAKHAAGSRMVLQLHDLATGKLLAVMDGAQVTALASSLMGALSVDVLARPDAKHVAILGSGAPVSGVLKALRLVRSIERVWLFSPDAAANFELTMKLQQSLSMAVSAVDSAADAVEAADIVILTGGVALPTAPKPGVHVTVLNAAGFDGAPLTAPADAKFVSDSALLPKWLPAAVPLQTVLTDAPQGRTSDQQVTVFVSLAPPMLDLIAAWHVLEGARTDDGLTRFDLEA